jgi:hypothetical protein
MLQVVDILHIFTMDKLAQKDERAAVHSMDYQCPRHHSRAMPLVLLIPLWIFSGFFLFVGIVSFVGMAVHLCQGDCTDALKGIPATLLFGLVGVAGAKRLWKRNRCSR